MNYKSWKDILNEYTRIFENCRYDHITKDANTYIADFMDETNTMTNPYYMSFGTYRHDITADTSIVKINETKLNEKIILDNFYDINSETINYIFSGIVLNKQFAVNGNELSLEDLFAEYGYDYLKAIDASLIAHNKEPIYFQQTKTENGKTIQGGYYNILPIDSIIIEKNNKGEDIETSIKYDGTYVPTVEEILTGNLYIVIKSGDMKEQKIFFNNKFLPTLFINDDKYPSTDLYLLENQQTLKLCDLCMFQKLGCQIIWNERLIILKNIKYIKYKILEQIQSVQTLENFNQNNIYFEFEFQVKIKLNTETQWHYIVTNTRHAILPAESLSSNKDIDLSITDNKDFLGDTDIIDYINTENNYNYLLSPFKNNNTTGKLTMNTNEIPKLLLEFTMGVSLILNGFTTKYVEQETLYSLSWYEYIEDDNINYELYINISNSNDIKINNNIPDDNSNIKLTLNNNKIPNTYTINMNLTGVIIENISFYFYIKKIMSNDDNQYILTPTKNDTTIITSEYTNIYEIKPEQINDITYLIIRQLNTPQYDVNKLNIDLGTFYNEILNKNIQFYINFYNKISN